MPERARAHHHVDAGGDHRRRVDEGGDGRRAGHGVGQPDVEGNLRAFARGAQEQQQADDGGRPYGQAVGACGHLGEDQRAQRRPDHEHGQQHAKIANAVDDERLFAAVGVPAIHIVALVEPEADEQIGRQAHALPADEHPDKVVAHHQDQHGQDEEVQVEEEALIARLVCHVADGVDVDQRTDAGHHQGHEHAERVDEHRGRDMQVGHGHPLPPGDGDRLLLRRQTVQRKEEQHRHAECGERGGRRDPADHPLRQTRPQEQDSQRAERRKSEE